MDEIIAAALAYQRAREVGLTCGRCQKTTGNNTQGHYWRWCKITGSMRDFHFCCPDDCQLENN